MFKLTNLVGPGKRIPHTKTQGDQLLVLEKIFEG